MSRRRRRTREKGRKPVGRAREALKRAALSPSGDATQPKCWRKPCRSHMCGFRPVWNLFPRGIALRAYVLFLGGVIYMIMYDAEPSLSEVRDKAVGEAE